MTIRLSGGGARPRPPPTRQARGRLSAPNLAATILSGALAAALLVATILVEGCTTLGGTGSPGPASVMYPVEKLRPREKPPAPDNAELRLGGGEWECAGFVIAAPAGAPLRVERIELAIEGAPAVRARLYAVEYLDIVRPSRWYRPAVKGSWPDPLVLLGDLGVSAYPRKLELERAFTVPGGENRWLLADFLLERGGPREGGRARLSFALADGGEAEASLVIAPYAFDLPEKPRASTAFGTALTLLREAHERITGAPVEAEALDALTAAYLRTFTEHRIDVWAPAISVGWDPTAEPGERADWGEYDSEIGRWLDGSLAPDLKPLPYARPPRPPRRLPPEEQVAFEDEVERHFAERGWSDRLLYYEFDEPYLSEYGRFAEGAESYSLLHPGAKTILTEPYQPELDSLVDIWCPDIPTLGDTVPLLPILTRGQGLRPEWHRSPPPEVYGSLRSRGKEAWLYTCMSASFLDYPDLFIDSPAAAARAIPWLMFRRGFNGLLYYNSMYSYAAERDPWKDQYQFWTNGDGNLLYPLGPDRSASGAHEPAPSLRMKLLREGLEDYEYLAAYEAAAGAGNAAAAAEAVASTGLSWERAIGGIAAKRDALGASLDVGTPPARLAGAAPGRAATGSEAPPAPAGGAAFNLWVPGAALDLWLPLSGANRAYGGGALRFDLAYVIDPSTPGSLGRLRWERYLEFDALLPWAGGEPIFLLLAGMNGSFERGGPPGRSFLIPYAGLEAGLAIGSGGTAFAALPLLGLALTSLPGFTLSLEARLLATSLGSGFLGLGGFRLVSAFTF